MITSSFFNSVNGDRKYDASKFAEYFNSFIGNGVFPNPSDNLQIMAQLTPDMTVIVKPGKAWVNGYILINDDDYILQIEPADGVLNRIDRIVARYDVANREITLTVKKGTFASSPIAPTLQRDADAYELGLADVHIGKGIVNIVQANITDLRLSKELCGIVHGLVNQIDTETLFLQYQDWMKNRKNDMNDWFYSTQAEFTDEFYIWFNGLQNIFDTSAEGNILAKVDDINNKVIVNRIEITDIKLKLSEQNIINFLNKTGIGFYDLFDSLDYIDDVMTTANVDIVSNNVKFIDTKLLKMKNETFDNFNNLELNIYDDERVTINAMANSVDNKLKVIVTPGSIIPGDKFYYKGKIYTVSSITEGM